jgi:transposase
VLVVDQAGWHLSDKLIVPPNITLVPLPPKCPELNPVENIWQFIRGNWLFNGVFRSYDDILEHCCFAWEKARRPAIDHHVDRIARLGTSVPISGTW